MASGRTLTLGVACAGALAALLAAGYWALHAGPPTPSTERIVEAPKGPPQLYCMLIRLTGEPRLELLFNISRVGGQPHYEQVHLAEFIGQDKTLKQPPFPEWRFDASAEPARLESEISVFDNSAAGSHIEKITVELYAYRPERGNREWIESGLKSIHYQNLSGKCQQTGPVPLVSTSN